MNDTSNAPVDSPLNPVPRAVVVGASSGIGEAMARKLAREGYRVALLARRREALDNICKEINQQFGESIAVAYQHDVTKYDEVPKVFQQVLRDLKQIDVFVYVSGVQYRVGFSEYDFNKESEMVEVNLLGAMAWLGQAAILFERMGRGHIVGISSVAGDRGRVGNPAYNTSKAGLSTYLEALRNRLTRSGVHVLTVKPGFVQTELLKNAATTFGVISPEKLADAIWRAIRKRRQVIYAPRWWRLIMLIIRHTPSFIFRRLSF
jgi:short-subunit dehydrogenase